MKIEKTILDNIEKVYATCINNDSGKLTFIGCSEGVGCGVSISNGERKVMWETGGTMNCVKAPGHKDTFLATQKFYPVFAAQECALNCARLVDGKWEVAEIMNTPYLHRFDIFEKNGSNYLIGATLCKSKSFQQDWSSAGSVYIGKLGDDLTRPIELKEIFCGITKNHGMWKCEKWNDKMAYLISGVEGAFAFEIPNNPIEDEWKIEKIIDREVSDIATCDIDGDGVLEIATIEPFHGSKCVIYKKQGDKYLQIKDFDIEFGHVIWGGLVAGENVFILGYRKQDMQLRIIKQIDKEFETTIIDENVGPSQISVANVGDVTYILSANRQINELACYKITQ